MYRLVTDINGKFEVIKSFDDYFSAFDYFNENYNLNGTIARHYWIEKV